MATENANGTKILTFTGLKKYDELIKAKIEADVAGVDAKITNIINGTDNVKVKTAETADSATTAETAEKLGIDNVGDINTPIYLNEGVATEISSVAIENGGTGATDSVGARTNLDVYSTEETNDVIENAIKDMRETVEYFFAEDVKVEGLVDTLVEIQDVLRSDETGTVGILQDISELQNKVNGYSEITTDEIATLFDVTTQE